MTNLEAKALHNLANLNDSQQDIQFLPYKSTFTFARSNPLNRKHPITKRPQTCSHKKQISIKIENDQNNRLLLKRELQFLEDHTLSPKQQSVKDVRTRKVTAKSIISMQSSSLCNTKIIKNYANGFPAKPIKKISHDSNGNWKFSNKQNHQNEQDKTKMQISYINMNKDITRDEMIRLNIKKRLERRQNKKKSEHISKLNNFLKMNHTKRITSTTILMQKLQHKMKKKTLNNILT